jgi:hypothetical protein
MTTSNYMVDVKVEIAFNAGFLTPAASRVWTDVSTYVELDQGSPSPWAAATSARRPTRTT